MIHPQTSDLLRAAQWILESGDFMDLEDSWSLPTDFEKGIDFDYLQTRLSDWSNGGFNQRMGRLFEALVLALFEAHRDYEVLDHNVGIFNGKQQITEIDLILLAPGGKGLHLEVAVKFYLDWQSDGVHHVVGPNGRDVLAHRLDRFQRQLEFGKTYCQENYPELSFEHKLFTRGRIFTEQVESEVHPYISTKAERGTWGVHSPNNGRLLYPRWRWISWPPPDFEPISEPSNPSVTHWLLNTGEHYIQLSSRPDSSE